MIDSPPHRRLRKIATASGAGKIYSPPHRRLRNVVKLAGVNQSNSPPHRRLRNVPILYGERDIGGFYASAGIYSEDDKG